VNEFTVKMLAALNAQYQSGYDYGPNTTQIGIVVAGMVVILFLFMWVTLRQITKCGPNETMIISGRRTRIRDSSGQSKHVNFRIVEGGATFVWPFIERVDKLSMELAAIDVGAGDRFEIAGVPIKIEGVLHIKIKNQPFALATAAELFLNSGVEETKRVGASVVDAKIRASLNSLTIDELSSNHDGFIQQVREAIEADLANMGLEVLSFTIYVTDIPAGTSGFSQGGRN
jgi:flotillin